MNLAEILDPRAVLLDVVARDKWDVLARLVGHATAVGLFPAPATEAVLAAVVAREQTLATGLEEGLAVPHGFSAAVPASRVVFARLAAGVDFGGFDGAPADLVVLFLAPDDAAARLRHPVLLGQVVTALASPGVAAAARAASTPAAFVAALLGSR